MMHVACMVLYMHPSRGLYKDHAADAVLQSDRRGPAARIMYACTWYRARNDVFDIGIEKRMMKSGNAIPHRRFGANTMTTQVATVNPHANQRNADNSVKLALSIVAAKEQADTGAIHMVWKARDMIAALNERLTNAPKRTEKGEVNVEGTIRAYVAAVSPEGEALEAQREKLGAIRKKTSDQSRRFEVVKARQRQLAVLLRRSIDILRGVRAIEQHGGKVTFRSVKESKITDAVVTFRDKSAVFSANLLMKAAEHAEVIKTATHNADGTAREQVNVDDMRQDIGAAAYNRKPRAAEQGGKAIPVAKIIDVITALDTTLARVMATQEGIKSLPKGTRDAVAYLFGRLDAELPADVKAHGRDVYADDADTNQSDAA